MSNEFRCQRCYGKELCFERLATIRANLVVHDDGHIAYEEFEISDDITQSPQYNYVCRGCGWRLHIGEYCIELESDLMHYLSKSFDEIKAANEAYYAEASEDDIDSYDELIDMSY